MTIILTILAFFTCIGLISLFAKRDKDIIIIIGVLVLLTSTLEVIGFLIGTILLICYYKNN